MSRIRVVALLLILLVLRPLAAGDRMIATSRTFFTDFDGETTVELFRAGDFTADGHNDVLIAAAGAVKVYPGSGTGLFGDAIATSIDGYRILGVADLNEDGRPDLFLTDTQYSYLLGVMLGNANGTFGTISTTTTTVEIMSAAAADFDGDTHLDLAVAGMYPYRVLGFFGNGNGTFSAPTESAEFTNHVRLEKAATGDIDGDGNVDAIFGTSGGAVRVFFSDGDRGFTAGPVVHRLLDYSALVVADLDNDGNADVVTGRYSSPDSSAEITFSRGRTLAAPQEIAVRDAYDAAAADLDGDGVSELVLASGTSVAVLKRGGPASLGRPRLFRVGRHVHSLAVADFDGDAKLDVVTMLTGWTYPTVSFSLTRGNGDGTFLAAPAIDIQADVRDTFREDHDLGIADVNGDALPDLITATYSWAVVQGEARYALAVLLARVGGGYAAPVFTVVPHNTYEEHHSAFAGDLNADGRPEVIVNSGVTRSGEPVRWTVMSANADGTFNTLSTWSDTVGLMRLVDATGDGRIDVLDRAGYIRPGNGTATFGPKLADPVDLSYGVPYFVDLNNDGRLDRLGSSGNQLHARLANADGSFSAVIHSAGNGIDALGDLNGDGFPDIVSVPSYTFVQLGNGNGSFGTPFHGLKSPETRDVATDAGGSPAASSQTISLGAHNTFDFDADGHLDAFIGTTIYYGDGTGHFTDFVSVPAEYVSWVFLHDLTGDGKPEIVLREMFGATAFIRVGVPRGTIAPALTITPSVNPSEHRQTVTITARLAASNMIPNGPLWVSAGSTTTRVEMVNGTATVNETLVRGTTTVSASFAGDDHIAAATASYEHVATQAPTTTTVRARWTTRELGQSVLIGATVATSHVSSLYADNVILKKGSTVLGTVPTGSSYRTFSDPALFPIGTHMLIAEFPGTDDFGASTSVPLTITITKATPAMTLSIPTSPLVARRDARLIASFPNHPNVTGSVTFKAGHWVIGTVAVAGGTAQFDGPLIVTGKFDTLVTATYSGDETHASTAATTTVTIYQGGFETVPNISMTLSLPVAGGWSVAVAPTPLLDATSYDFYRSIGGAPFSLWRSVPASGPWPTTDQPAASEMVRLYRVIARDASGNSSQPSPVAIALGMLFQDRELTSGTTRIKAVHFTEAQTAVNAIRAAAGLPAASFRRIAPGASMRLEDMTDLRQALTEARSALGLTTWFHDATLTRGMAIRARHLQDLRDAMW